MPRPYAIDVTDYVTSAVEVEPAGPDLPLIRVKLLDARCHDCKADVTVWRTAVGRLVADRRGPGDPIMERHACALTLAGLTATLHV